MDDKTILGVIGTAVGTAGAGLSATEIQAIVSTVITVAGFFISVILPLIIKLVNKINEAKKDGKIDKGELKDIVETGKEIVDAGKEMIDTVKKDKE